eukprot:6289804-Amphidinium_carterae.2
MLRSNSLENTLASVSMSWIGRWEEGRYGDLCRLHIGTSSDPLHESGMRPRVRHALYSCARALESHGSIVVQYR